MSEIAIRVEGLGKRYRIGAAAERPTNLREAMSGLLQMPLRNLRRLRGLSSFAQRDDSTSIWALRDVSFEVRHGEVLGVIGRNGAGKSTLLKILSRITEPTTGYADLGGRVGSLLEVGTGFHPELTGRENVYLNGAILGMDRARIHRQFDEIVEFSGIDKFIDTPVKRYSSGMYLRLAFAVAAHLEPEILIVDEVLAVGDLEFQKKCIGRMDEVAREGRTVLFVSHNLGAVQRLCTRAILLTAGRVVEHGDTGEVIKHYLASGGAEAPAARWLDVSAAQRSGSGSSRIVAIQYSSTDAAMGFRPYPGGALELAVRIRTAALVPRVSLGFTIRDQFGTTLMSGSTNAIGLTEYAPEGTSTWRIRIASLFLRPGIYQLDVWLGDAVGVHDRLQPALKFEVFDRQNHGARIRFNGRHDGMVFCEYAISAIQNDEQAANRLPHSSESASAENGAMPQDVRIF